VLLVVAEKIPAEDTPTEILVRMLRKDSDKMPIVSSGIAEPGVILVYPKNYDFITDLPRPLANRIEKHGWEMKKTIFLEIPYIVTFYRSLEPSMVHYWPLMVPSENSLFRIMSFTRGYVSSAHFMELEDSIIHEQEHMISEEPFYLKGETRPTSTEETESKIEATTFKKMFQRYGPKWEHVRRNALVNAFKMQAKVKTIMSGVLEYWMQLYLLERFKEYEQFSIKLDKSVILDAYIKDMEDNYREVSLAYKEVLNFKVKPFSF